ncbi:MAG: hypothetical protein ACKV19_07290 [Verrucomicrobiales bacterium]
MLLPSSITHPIWFLALAASILGLSSATLSTGQTVPTPPVVAPPPAARQDVPVAVSDLTSLNRLLPVGKTALRVTVPTVDEEGHLTSVITMGSITRLDEENFRLEKVVLTSFEPAAVPDGELASATTAPEQTVIRLVDATYHAPTRVLASEKPVTVRKPTIFLSGSSLHYDSAVGRAVMKGQTRAILTEIAPPEPLDEPTEEPLDDEDDEDDEMSPEPIDPSNPQRQ